DSGGRSPLIIKDLDLYPQPPTNTRSPTLNSEEPVYCRLEAGHSGEHWCEAEDEMSEEPESEE
ncbi:MAG: hypothetical protein KH140_09215, partial [Actinomyces sp.]|nr:hypothetical protein [Actinomyces sp.]